MTGHRDVVLIQPRDPMLDIQVYDAAVTAAIEMPPIGLIYLGTVLKNAGFAVELVDLNTLSDPKDRQEAIQHVVDSRPKLVGISTTTPTFPAATEIVHALRKRLGATVAIIMGGYHATALPEECLKAGVDAVVRGEGEGVIVNLAKLFLGNEPRTRLAEVPGISYFDETRGTVHTPPRILRIHDLDALPFPDRDLIDVAKYRSPATIIATRGCPARCIFCAAGVWGPAVSRSPENVVDEVQLPVRKYHFKSLYFVDNTFVVDKNRTMQLLSLLRERKIHITFTLETRVSSVDEELIRALAQAGCLAIQFGVESGNEEVLRRIRKGITLEQVDNAVDLCLRYNITPLCSFIIGHPYDDRNTVRDTIEYAKKLKRRGAMVAFAVLEAYPGTEVFAKREELGVRILDWDFAKWTVGHVVVETQNLSRIDLINLYREALSEVYAV